MNDNETTVASQEALDYQRKSALFSDLTAAITQYRDQKHYGAEGFQNAGLDKIVKEHTNLNVSFQYISSPMVNAWIELPMIDVNHVLFSHYRGRIMESIRYDLSKVAKTSEEMRGWVDLKEGKVGGLFAEVSAKMSVISGLVDDVKGFDADHVAAIILHEIGHFFTYLEKTVTTVTMNMAIYAATERTFSTDDRVVRTQYIKDFKKTLDIDVEDPEQLAQVDDKDAFQAVILKTICDQTLHHSADSPTYDMRSCEFLSDQYAVRQGAGRALAVALDRMHRKYRAYSTQNVSLFVAGEAIKTGLLIVSSISFPYVVLPIAALLLMSSMSPENRIYDDPVERIQRIRRDLIQVVKDQSIPVNDRRRILSDVDIIGALVDGLKDRRTLFNYLWIALTPTRRKQFTQLRFQQGLEKIINNEVYVHAAKLQQLSDTHQPPAK